MTTRERFRRVMAGDAAVDRLPAIEWAYWWDKTLELWYGQGLPRGLDEAAMADFVGIDRNTQFWLPHKIPDCPRETSHGRGIVENESDYERLRPYLLPENAVQQMLPKIRQTLPFYENGQTLVWYTLSPHLRRSAGMADRAGGRAGPLYEAGFYDHCRGYEL